jgi:hypothetical protein
MTPQFKQTLTMSQERYAHNEAMILSRDLQRIEQASLSDRQEARREFSRIIQHDLAHVFKCLDYLMNGDYGFGSIDRIRKMSKRMNRRAQIFTLLAALEYQCPAKFACEVWNGLDTDLQAAINAEIDKQLAYMDGEK